MMHVMCVDSKTRDEVDAKCRNGLAQLRQNLSMTSQV